MTVTFNHDNDVVLLEGNKKITFVRYSEPKVELVDLAQEINYNNTIKEK
jgi:hypothetical protein